MKSFGVGHRLRQILISLVFPVVITACATHPEVVFKPKDPTHKLVCECTCDVPGPVDTGLDTTITVDPPAGGCGTLNGAKCRVDSREGKTKSCNKVVVPTELIAVEAEAVDVVARP